MNSQLSQFSESLSTLAAEAGGRLYHVPSPLGGKTAVSFDGKRLLVPAVQAERDEKLTVLAPGGKEVEARVIGFDTRQGLAVLELSDALAASAWVPEAAMPALGSLVLAAAYPSPEGVEARLDMVRITKGGAGDDDAYLQTDGASFPGFAGGALVSPSGKLTGVIVADRPGNGAWALPAEKARKLLDSIAARGFPRRAWLGISTVPVSVPEAWKASLGGRALATMIAGLETGGPAELAGLLPGDLIISLGGTLVERPGDLSDVLGGLEAGAVVRVELLRGGKSLGFDVKTGEAPREGSESAEGEGDCCGGGQGRRGPFGMRGFFHGRQGHGGPGHHGHHRGGAEDGDCCGGGHGRHEGP
jgi:serine protease DegS